ncbi:hypothetical protein BF49_3523 [Bradyrhizobium sp.]|nr:hypothetical protein BF49_3523 [Bradyrhizobium sp.]
MLRAPLHLRHPRATAKPLSLEALAKRASKDARPGVRRDDTEAMTWT